MPAAEGAPRFGCLNHKVSWAEFFVGQRQNCVPECLDRFAITAKAGLDDGAARVPQNSGELFMEQRVTGIAQEAGQGRKCICASSGMIKATARISGLEVPGTGLLQNGAAVFFRVGFKC